MRQLFGTDGIRGKAHEYPLDRATMFALGEALGHRLRKGSVSPVVLLGMDTRESGPEIARALIAGVASGGGAAQFIGVVPTPAVAYLCRVSDASAGISISASHNPFHDNGVKVFGHDGMKLSDDLEEQIEDELLSLRKENPEIPHAPLDENPPLIESYETFLIQNRRSDFLRGQKVVLDTGHGAAYRIGPEVFRRLGGTVTVINDQPDGTNINENSGALHPQGLADVVVKEQADFGVAFDGDADRAIFVDDKGVIRNGDEILYLWARRDKRRGELRSNTVVATVMSNYGFEKKFEKDGIRLLRAGVGDKYVLEKMLEAKASLGGEQSGHIIDLKVHTTGDGIHTALEMAALLKEESKPFSALDTFEPMPQILVNQKVSSKPPLESLPRFQAAASRAEARLSGTGRILVRYSGTENLVRVMVEGEDQKMIESIAHELVKLLAEEIGTS